MINHSFTATILEILTKAFGQAVAAEVFQRSALIQYLNLKTRSATRGSKSRSAFANHYALYVLIEDYLEHEFDTNGMYSNYEGAKFTDLFRRQRELPFGAKLQNHALNHRLNEEFRKYFPAIQLLPILRNVETARYWINEQLLLIPINGVTVNIARSVINIIDAYVASKQSAFNQFLTDWNLIQQVQDYDLNQLRTFVASFLRPNVDARIFEIISYAILKRYYANTAIYWGFSLDDLKREELRLYKTGRTNANDGGIDFVMKPLGRFFQVTETIDVRKYFLDIDKVQRFPLTFVIKSEQSQAELRGQIREQATRVYTINEIIEKYMGAIEEIINIPMLLTYFDDVIRQGGLKDIVDEIDIQSRVEFNYIDT